MLTTLTGAGKAELCIRYPNLLSAYTEFDRHNAVLLCSFVKYKAMVVRYIIRDQSMYDIAINVY